MSSPLKKYNYNGTKIKVGKSDWSNRDLNKIQSYISKLEDRVKTFEDMYNNKKHPSLENNDLHSIVNTMRSYMKLAEQIHVSLKLYKLCHRELKSLFFDTIQNPIIFLKEKISKYILKEETRIVEKIIIPRLVKEGIDLNILVT